MTATGHRPRRPVPVSVSGRDPQLTSPAGF